MKDNKLRSFLCAAAISLMAVGVARYMKGQWPQGYEVLLILSTAFVVTVCILAAGRWIVRRSHGHSPRT